MPPLQKRFKEIAGAMLAQIRIFELPIQNRRQTRDLLLPCLLSRQVELDVLRKIQKPDGAVQPA